ncbi:MAG: sigma 54-interacting transcriptional regulator, partial [Gemmataceae bacterium]
MSFARRVLLVGTDHRFGQSFQTHLHKTFLLTAPVVRFDDVPQLVNAQTDGVIVFLAATAADLDRIDATIRELQLQEFPAKLGVVLAPEVTNLRRVERPNPSVPRFQWIEQLKDINSWIKRVLTEGMPFIDPSLETMPERIRRRLLVLTPSLTPFVDQLVIASSHEVTVLIEGETGTGKTHLAKLIHDCSARAANRFLVVGCGALTGNLIASEFFGHAKGAFTGADFTKVGKFAAAGEGTILLDEI